MRPRVVDIAKMADVSPATVSLVLNHRSGVSEPVRRRILAIAGGLGYRPSVSRKSGVTVKLLKIATHGHIVNERHNAFITEYLEGIEHGAGRKGCKLEVSFFDRAPVEEIVAGQRDSGADGFIVLGTELSAHQLTFFNDFPLPLVFIDTYFPRSAFDCVDIDNTDGVFRAIEHLYQSGHRNIGLVKSIRAARNLNEREVSFREVMEYFSLPLAERNIFSVDPAFDRCHADMDRLLRKKEKLPTALLCANDIIAYGCIKALREHSVSIPDDVSIIGFDDLPSSSITDPPLTTVRVAAHQIGERALEKLMDRIEGNGHPHPEKLLVSGDLIIRESVRKL